MPLRWCLLDLVDTYDIARRARRSDDPGGPCPDWLIHGSARAAAALDLASRWHLVGDRSTGYTLRLPGWINLPVFDAEGQPCIAAASPTCPASFPGVDVAVENEFVVPVRRGVSDAERLADHVSSASAG